MDDAKLQVIEAIVTRMEEQNNASLTNIQNTLSGVRDNFQSHLIESAKQEQRLKIVEVLTDQHQNTLHGDKGLIKRLEAQENFTLGLQKIMWEIAKPGLAMLGGTLLVGVSILALMAYGLIAILQSLP